LWVAQERSGLRTMAEDQQAAPSSAFSLSDFERLETLGTGTFGRVYLVKHIPTNHFYAMKILRKKVVVRLKQVAHMQNEKNVLEMVDHPFVVNMIWSTQDTRNIYLLFEFVLGGELFSHLRNAGRFTGEMSRFYAAEILLALEYLHSKNIVYRDLKPENILLDRNGHVKITDFGFAKVVEDKTWTLCGTPEYLAPEIIKSKGYGKEVDWWSFGVLIYEMLAGYPPFFEENPFGIYEKILLGRLQCPAHFDSASRDIIKRLLTADRVRRLGNLKNGVEDIKRHRFFRGIDWEKLKARKVRAPIVPDVEGENDTTLFEAYDEEDGYELVPEKPPADPYADLFADF